MQYPDGTIGADPILRQTIQDMFNRLGEEREKRFSKQHYCLRLFRKQRYPAVKGS